MYKHEIDKLYMIRRKLPKGDERSKNIIKYNRKKRPDFDYGCSCLDVQINIENNLKMYNHQQQIMKQVKNALQLLNFELIEKY